MEGTRARTTAAAHRSLRAIVEAGSWTIAFAAAREGAFARFLYHLSDADALDHAVQLARHAIERRGWLSALDQSLVDARAGALPSTPPAGRTTTRRFRTGTPPSKESFDAE